MTNDSTGHRATTPIPRRVRTRVGTAWRGRPLPLHPLLLAAPVLGDGRRAALVVSALAAAILFYGHLASLLGPLGVRVGFQQIGWALLVGIVGLVAIRLRDVRLASVTRALNIVTALLVVFSLVTIVHA